MAPVTLAGLAHAGTIPAGRRSSGSTRPTSKRAEKTTARPKPCKYGENDLPTIPDFSETRRRVEKGPSGLLGEQRQPAP
jgi:hypothetical protein